MGNNMIEVLQLERVIYHYLENRNFILIVINLLCCGTIFLMLNAYHNDLGWRNILSQFFISLMQLFTAAAVGAVLQSIGIAIQLKAKNIDEFIFLLLTIILLLFCIFELVRHKYFRGAIISKFCAIYHKLLIALVIFMNLANDFELVEFLTFCTLILCLKMIHQYTDLHQRKKADSILFSQKKHIPIQLEEDLYPSRKRQLQNFSREIENIKAEPYAIMISAPWGNGKTSFMHAFCHKNQRDEFILIDAGIECDIKNLLEYIGKQLESIFETNGFYAGRGKVIENYFEHMSRMIGSSAHEMAGDILTSFHLKKNRSFAEDRNKINELLLEFYAFTEKRIYLIVDDLDRTKPEVREKMFDIIRESTFLNNCTILFLADFDHFKTEQLTKEYLEKYINYHLILEPITFEEIVKENYNDFLNDKFLKNKNEDTKQKAKKLKKEMIKKSLDCLIRLEAKKAELFKALKKLDLRDDEQRKKQLYYNNYLRNYELLLMRMKNIRQVKEFLYDNIEKMISIIDIAWFSDEGYQSNSFSDYNWLDSIYEVSFLKCFLHEEYDCLISSGSIDVFLENKNCLAASMIISGLDSQTAKKELLDMLIYNLYTLDGSLKRPEQQKLLEEIKGGNLKEEHLLDYIKKCLTYDIADNRLESILHYLEKRSFEDPAVKKAALLKLMEKFSSHLIVINETKVIEMLSALIKNTLGIDFFSEQERLRAEEYIERLVKRYLTDASFYMVSVLDVVFDTEDSKEYISNTSESLNELCEGIMEFNEKHSADFRFDEDETALVNLEGYFKKIQSMILANPIQYIYVNNELNEFLNKIFHTFRMLQLWELPSDRKALPYHRFDVRDIYKADNNEDPEQLIKTIEGFHESIQQYEKDPYFTVEAFDILIAQLKALVTEDPEWDPGKIRVAAIKLEDIYKRLDRLYSEIASCQINLIECKLTIYKIKKGLNMLEG